MTWELCAWVRITNSEIRSHDKVSQNYADISILSQVAWRVNCGYDRQLGLYVHTPVLSLQTCIYVAIFRPTYFKINISVAMGKKIYLANF